jgi:gamma-glutamyltranspeptidase/glutathione hydrolase
MFEVLGKPPGHPGDVWRVKVKDDANRLGFRAMFAPSTVAGYWYLVKNYGTLSWKEVMAPAIKVAEEGFIADELYVNAVKASADLLKGFPGSAEMYMPGGKLPQIGERIVFQDLARTLKKLAEEGEDAFYKGEIADKIVQYVQKNGGILTKEDFTSYRVEVSPLKASQYRGHTILTYPQASNGSTIAEVLNILSTFDLRKMGFDTVESVHVFIEALKLAFIDRYEYVGDRDFVPVPYDGLMEWGYGRERAKQINMKNAQLFKPRIPGFTREAAIKSMISWQVPESRRPKSISEETAKKILPFFAPQTGMGICSF